jgi:alkanesulfonate monooxygenase SsuD/methylene tetrahydromethanopterin reductase-like flavin-dependent oxidoreductase (luciferase family)
MEQGFAVFAGLPADVIRATAQETEAQGYGSFWVNHPGSVDGLAALAVAARETRRIALGIGVIPLHTRGPESIAEGVRTQGLPLDRLLLGVGSPGPGALARVLAGVNALRASVSTRLVVAALGPKMCRLAGEIADGVLFNWLTPEYARASGDLVRAGAADKRRPAPALYAYVRLAIGPRARARLVEEGERYAAIPAYGAHFQRMGIKPEETAIAVERPEEIAPALARWRGVVDGVVLRAITPADTLDEHLALVRAAAPA